MQLKNSWITDPVFDFEHKKYQILAYLQEKNKALSAYRIFPHINELNDHLSTLRAFRENKEYLDEHFRKELEGIDLNELALKFRPFPATSSVLNELWRIIDYSNEQLSGCYQLFVAESEALSQLIKFELIGLLPGYRKEGFLLIRQERGIYLFSYETQPILDTEGELKINYQYLRKYPASKLYTEENIKLDVLKTYRKQFDHPAVFAITSEKDLPIYETILPISRNELKKWVA